jgi:hypothetical protein
MKELIEHGVVERPRHDVGAVRCALNPSRFIVGTLPGNLDDTGKPTLIRLIREGLLIALSN